MFRKNFNLGADQLTEKMKNAILFGFLITLGLMIWVLVRFYMGAYSDPAPRETSYIDYFSGLIPLIGLYFGIRRKRERFMNGHISYGEAFREGMLISLFTGIFSVIFYLVFYRIHPETLEMARNVYEMPDATWNLVLAVELVVQFLASILGGLIFSLILAAVLKRTSPHSVA